MHIDQEEAVLAAAQAALAVAAATLAVAAASVLMHKEEPGARLVIGLSMAVLALLVATGLLAAMAPPQHEGDT